METVFNYWLISACLKYILSLILLVNDGKFSLDDVEDNEWYARRGMPFRLLFLLALPWMNYFVKQGDKTDSQFMFLLRKISYGADITFILLTLWLMVALSFE